MGIGLGESEVLKQREEQGKESVSCKHLDMEGQGPYTNEVMDLS